MTSTSELDLRVLLKEAVQDESVLFLVRSADGSEEEWRPKRDMCFLDDGETIEAVMDLGESGQIKTVFISIMSTDGEYFKTLATDLKKARAEMIVVPVNLLAPSFLLI